MEFVQIKKSNNFNSNGILKLENGQILKTPLIWFGLSFMETFKFQTEVFKKAKIEAFLSNAYDLIFQDKSEKRKKIIQFLCENEKLAHKMDSGGFQLMKANIKKKKIPKYFNQEFVFNFQSKYENLPQISVQLDCPLTPSLNKRQQMDKISKSLSNYDIILNLKNGEKTFFLPVVHAYDEIQLNFMVNGFLTKFGQYKLKMIGIGSLVPMVKTMGGTDKIGGFYRFIDNLLYLRYLLPTTCIHAFGIGGTMSYLAVYCGVDSLDSNGWIQKSGYGVIQLPGISDRFPLPKSHNRPFLMNRRRSKSGVINELDLFIKCECEACKKYKAQQIKQKLKDFDGTSEKSRFLRAIHNVSLFQNEIRLMGDAIKENKLEFFLEKRLRNSKYKKYFEYIKNKKKILELNVIPEENFLDGLKIISILLQNKGKNLNYKEINSLLKTNYNPRFIYRIIKNINSGQKIIDIKHNGLNSYSILNNI